MSVNYFVNAQGSEDPSIVLPDDTQHVWARLVALTKLSWPTLAEQVERAALVDWINPSSGGLICSEHVLVIAQDKVDIGAVDLHETRSAANAAWRNLMSLATGDKLDNPRPECSDYQSNDGFDNWSDLRRKQAGDWLSTVMRTIDDLLCEEIIFGCDLPKMVTSAELESSMHREFYCEAFDSPLAIGAHMFTGLSFGSARNHDAFILVAEGLADAVLHIVDELKTVTKNEGRNKLTHLQFMWMLLKGYVFAVTKAELDVPYLFAYVKDDAQLRRIYRALLEGRETLCVASKQYGAPASWYSLGSQTCDEVAAITIEELIAATDEVVARARQLTVTI